MEEPTFLIDEKDLPLSIIEVLARTKITSSKREAKQLIEQNGISFQPPGQDWQQATLETALDRSHFGPPTMTVTAEGQTFKVRLTQR